MANNIKCPHCNSEKVYIVDSESLASSGGYNESKSAMNVDNEIYATFHCDSCKKSFTGTGDILWNKFYK